MTAPAEGEAPEGGGHRSAAGRPRPAALHRYGQHHLVDPGTLNAILAMADVHKDDVVLEVGAAGGLLTRPLLERAAAVHAYEIDHRFLPALQELAEARSALRLHAGDALKDDLGALDPSPTALVANLAYSIAIPLIVRSLTELPSVRRWAVMVQKELGERLFARPRTKAYSAVSVLVQLRCRLEATRAVSRTVFSPPPRVDSSFVVFVRDEPGAIAPRDWKAIDRLVRAAFSQRRKLLTNSLVGVARGREPAVTAAEVRAALESLGLSDRTRPEELEPSRFPLLAERLDMLAQG